MQTDNNLYLSVRMIVLVCFCICLGYYLGFYIELILPCKNYKTSYDIKMFPANGKKSGQICDMQAFRY